MSTTYIIDFDRVIFSWDAYLADLVKHGLEARMVDPAVWDTLSPEEYFYDDALGFLKSCGRSQVVIISAASPHLGPQASAYQERKVADSGIESYAREVIVMVGDKGPYVCPYAEQGQVVFIDDKLTHHESIRQTCPDVVTIQMVRNDHSLESGISDREDIPVVSNFTEVNAILEVWQRGT